MEMRSLQGARSSPELWSLMRQGGCGLVSSGRAVWAVWQYWSMRHWRAIISSRGSMSEDAGCCSSPLVGPEIENNGSIVAPLDAVLAFGEQTTGAFLTGIVRHAELSGAVALTSAEALTGFNDPVHAIQMLWAARIPTVVAALSSKMWSQDAAGTEARRPSLVGGLVLDGKILIGGRLEQAEQFGDRVRPKLVSAPLPPRERRLMLETARSARIGSGADRPRQAEGGPPVVAGVDASPALFQFAGTAKADVAAVLIKVLEKRAREGRSIAASPHAFF